MKKHLTKSVLPRMAAEYGKIHLGWLFRLAYDFNEVRVHPTNLRMIYNVYCDSDVCMQFVEDFALDILAGRVKFKLPPVRGK